MQLKHGKPTLTLVTFTHLGCINSDIGVGTGTSSDTTRKCAEVQTLPFNNGWRSLQVSPKDPAFAGFKGWVLEGCCPKLGYSYWLENFWQELDTQLDLLPRGWARTGPLTGNHWQVSIGSRQRTGWPGSQQWSWNRGHAWLQSAGLLWGTVDLEARCRGDRTCLGTSSFRPWHLGPSRPGR